MWLRWCFHSDPTAPSQRRPNTDGYTRFVTRSITEAAGTEFEDELQWISPNNLAYQLVGAGRLN